MAEAEAEWAKEYDDELEAYGKVKRCGEIFTKDDYLRWCKEHRVGRTSEVKRIVAEAEAEEQEEADWAKEYDREVEAYGNVTRYNKRLTKDEFLQWCKEHREEDKKLVRLCDLRDNSPHLLTKEERIWLGLELEPVHVFVDDWKEEPGERLAMKINPWNK